MTKPRWKLPLMAPALLAAGLALGADAPDDKAQSDQAAAQSTRAPEPPVQEPKADGKSPEEFIPTEDISEDLAVAYPVDI